MIARLVTWSMQHRAVVLTTWILTALAGAWVSAGLQFDALPDLTNNQVQILTRAPGLTPEEIERRVTRPVELALGGIPGLVTHRSSSRYGLSGITAVFDDAIDPYRVRQMVQERLTSVQLPPGAGTPELGPLSGGLGEIFQFTVSSDARTPAELLELVQVTLAPELRRIPGIVEANTWGGATRTLEVLIDPVRLSQRGLRIADVADALRASVSSVAGASLEIDAHQVLVRAGFLPSEALQLSEVTVGRDPNGKPVRVSDVAALREGALPRLGAATRDGRGETVYVMLQMLRGDNAREVMQRVHAAMPAAKRLLPEDVRVDVVYDRSVLVDRTLATMLKNLLEGGLLVIAVLFLLLGSLRAGLLVAAVIPLSMVGATTVMTLLGLPGNLMSLGAVDFGLIVDGAVVMVEGVFHAAAQRSDGASFAEVAKRAARHLATPVLFSVLVILVVYVPILTLTGVDGRMFRPMALTVVFALATALLASLTFVPAAITTVLDFRHVPERPPWIVRQLERLYPKALARAASRPAIVVAAFVLVLIVGGVLFSRAGSELAPQLDEGDLVIQTTRDADVSLDGAVRKGLALEAAVLAALPEAHAVSSRVGSPAVATDLMGYEQADVFVALRPREEWPAGVTTADLITRAERAIEAQAPGASPAFTQPIQMRFNELLGGAPMDVVVSVFGDDLTTLRALAEQVRAAVQPVHGVSDPKVLVPPDVPLLDVAPDALAAAQLGLTPAEVMESVRALRAGIPVASTYRGQVVLPVVLRLDAPADPLSLRSAPVVVDNAVVPLERVAHVEARQTTSLVQHDDGKRRVVVGFNVRGVDLRTAVNDAQRAVAEQVKPVTGYRFEWGGQLEVLEAAQRRMTVVVPLALVAILALLFAAFRSPRPVLVIATQVPFATVGGVVALAVRDMPVSIAAIVGFVALSGVAVMNGVVLLNETVENQRAGRDPRRAVREAAETRARPVLMTALVAMLGFVPMMLSHGVGAEVQRPLATVVVAGLLTSTLLTLFVLPVLYPLTYWRKPRGSR